MVFSHSDRNKEMKPFKETTYTKARITMDYDTASGGRGGVVSCSPDTLKISVQFVPYQCKTLFNASRI